MLSMNNLLGIYGVASKYIVVLRSRSLGTHGDSIKDPHDLQRIE